MIFEENHKCLLTGQVLGPRDALLEVLVPVPDVQEGEGLVGQTGFDLVEIHDNLLVVADCGGGEGEGGGGCGLIAKSPSNQVSQCRGGSAQHVSAIQ